MVSTDVNGNDDYVWAVTVVQCLKLFLNESPFWANYGLPAQASVASQVFPDFWMARLQQQFSSHFASLIISKMPSVTPTYRVSITTQAGVRLPLSEIPG